MDELFLRVGTSVDFGQCAELRVRTEDEVYTRAGPLDFARLAIAAFKHVCVLRDRLPLRAHVEQVHEEVVSQRFGSLGEDTMLRTAGVGAENAQAADEHRHFGRGQGQELRLVNQQRFRRHAVFALEVIAEAVGDGFEHREGFDVGLLLRGVHASRR